MNILRNRELMDKLCAEYVLGTLRGGARRRFETWLRDSDELKRTVAQWQDHLHPMVEMTRPATPPEHVWHAIERRLGLLPPKEAVIERKRAFWLGLREDLSFWRGLGMVSTTFALILLSVVLSRQIEPVVSPVQMMSTLAMLSDDKSQPVAVVTTIAATRQMTVKMIEPQPIAADKSLELWAVPKDGAPRSLGLVATSGTVTMILPENTDPESTPLLAISLEPKGGSPNPNAPTGPIIFKGTWIEI
jgi:anti-sigma-K factor RskA